jgi:hypothetical protein
MNKWCSICLFIGVFLSGKAISFGQITGQASVTVTLPSLTLLDIEPSSSSFTLSLSNPTEAGNPASTGSAATNNSNWLNYSVALPPVGSLKSVYVQIISGSLPAGTSLSLAASAFSGSGSGTFGSPAGSIVLSTTSQALITGIGRSFTGNGINNGHRLTYTLSVVNYAQLNYSQSSNLQIIYTISD